MVSTNALSVIVFHHHQNLICKKNLRSIQDIMHANETAAKKYKKFVMTSLILPYSP